MQKCNGMFCALGCVWTDNLNPPAWINRGEGLCSKCSLNLVFSGAAADCQISS